ncbi:Uma2 family endonuclease [Thermoleptolyngbya sichuanensis A183]|uniref:Uma2 family endonuclease n=1 Tax=Thermoleptolyngbya sichuanensis A183 TaxID=2737172 RepID=A0A6M8B8G4_9CYAN|nr:MULTISPECIES: Uma2 family endonuclease [Thermoleptolyngbya]MDG2616933.1 Uma2 family endonuclease [Thermoleptolyngbya sichuanensis XZ-Cy5]QKD83314.1 Uma2 family endonuclease [Thermoleptolyngbya sichuanensis A183]
MTIAPELRSLSVQDYRRMVEAGILAADERVELIEGQLYTMAAKGTAHSAAVTRIDRVLSQRLAGRALLRFQDPVQLSDFSQPEPDVAMVHPDPLDYEDHHPTPAEIFLLIEVADSTLRRDRDLKVPVYGRSGIQECWILDVQERRLYVFRDPGGAGYGAEQILSEQEAIAPLSFPDCVIQVSEFLRSPAAQA